MPGITLEFQPKSPPGNKPVGFREKPPYCPTIQHRETYKMLTFFNGIRKIRTNRLFPYNTLTVMRLSLSLWPE